MVDRPGHHIQIVIHDKTTAVDIAHNSELGMFEPIIVDLYLLCVSILQYKVSDSDLLLFDHRRFDAWWFETGTPTFPIKTLVERGTVSPSLDGMLGTSALLSKFDVDAIATEALLFQTGYLTVAGVEDLGGRPLYRLGYPNREVRQSLNESLLAVPTDR